jgi:dephospho-CoA kinase
MILIGLTGGIGLLTARGAEVIDADLIVRELQQPGAEVYEKMVELFGQEVVGADRALDRAAIAKKVFTDESLLKTLNQLIHPIVRRVMNERVESFRSSDKVVVLDIPLLVENPREGLDGVLVVDLDGELAVKRLALANHVIDNSGDRDELSRKVDLAWTWIKSLK